MIGEEKLNEFLQAVASWLASKNLPLVDENPKIKTILNMGSEELEGLSRDSCACYAYTKLRAVQRLLQSPDLVNPVQSWLHNVEKRRRQQSIVSYIAHRLV